MRVGQRLVLAVVPAIIGVFTVAALAYWGQYAHQAPEAVVIVAAVAAVLSLVLAWRNTRYVAHRVERLAAVADSARDALGVRAERTDPKAARGSSGTGTAPVSDELDTIERRVHGLSHAVRTARDDRTRREEAAEARTAESTALLEQAVATIGASLQEIQLPLHILLSSPFGELNENQEEMLAAARSAAETADIHLRQLTTLMALERGGIAMVSQPTGLGELLRPPLAMAEARASHAHVPFSASVSEAAPRARVDPRFTEEALTTLFTDAVERTTPDQEVTIDASEAEEGRIRITIARGQGETKRVLERRLALRLIEAQGGSVRDEDTLTVVDLPTEKVSQVPR